MGIGDHSAAEWRTYRDAETGRRIRQYTAAPAHSYPLYYYVPSITADGRFMVFHSERTGWVQLYRMDLNSGDITQLSEGTTRDSGWAVWCEYHLRGVFNHLSALNPVRGEVYYFADETVYRAALDTCTSARIFDIPGRIPIGQSAFSPDGKHFAFVHADAVEFRRSLADRESLLNMSLPFDHEAWRRAVRCTVTVLDTETAECVASVDIGHHAHHLLFIDDDTLLGCHTATGNGMWSMPLLGGPMRELRPADEHGRICHFVVTNNGILYDVDRTTNGEHTVWIGRYDPKFDTWDEVRLPPEVGYVHVGNDPRGRLLLIESEGERHHISALGETTSGDVRLHRLRTLGPIPFGQRHHAHPFVSPDGQRLFYTEVIEGYSQICSMDVAELPDACRKGGLL